MTFTRIQIAGRPAVVAQQCKSEKAAKRAAVRLNCRYTYAPGQGGWIAFRFVEHGLPEQFPQAKESACPG